MESRFGNSLMVLRELKISNRRRLRLLFRINSDIVRVFDTFRSIYKEKGITRPNLNVSRATSRVHPIATSTKKPLTYTFPTNARVLN